MFNEIEQAIVAVLADAAKGLPHDSGQPWYVPVAHIGRRPPDLKGNLANVLPAVCFALSEFTMAEDGFGIGELAGEAESRTELRKLRFDLLYHLDVWATGLDQANAIAQKAVECLLWARDGLVGTRGDDYRLLEIRPVAGRDVPLQLQGATAFRRQLDYRIESELLMTITHVPIREVIIEKVEWKIGEG